MEAVFGPFTAHPGRPVTKATPTYARESLRSVQIGLARLGPHEEGAPTPASTSDGGIRAADPTLTASPPGTASA